MSGCRLGRRDEDPLAHKPASELRPYIRSLLVLTEREERRAWRWTVVAIYGWALALAIAGVSIAHRAMWCLK